MLPEAVHQGVRSHAQRRVRRCESQPLHRAVDAAPEHESQVRGPAIKKQPLHVAPSPNVVFEVVRLAARLDAEHGA